uniref:Uncharacterized protein n=1 Tax=Arundo donax TaxID=35708 RepID=A0A0A8Z0U0_ARUDO
MDRRTLWMDCRKSYACSRCNPLELHLQIG